MRLMYNNRRFLARTAQPEDGRGFLFFASA
jgi:hypothetical protein